MRGLEKRGRASPPRFCPYERMKSAAGRQRKGRGIATPQASKPHLCAGQLAISYPPMAARDQLWGALASLKVCLSRPVGLAKRQILPPQPPILAISARATQKGRLSRLGDN